MIGDLIATLVGFPSLSRAATTALSDLAEAVAATATLAEIEALLAGAITEEACVRFACLQALSVRSQLLFYTEKESKLTSRGVAPRPYGP